MTKPHAGEWEKLSRYVLPTPICEATKNVHGVTIENSGCLRKKVFSPAKKLALTQRISCHKIYLLIELQYVTNTGISAALYGLMTHVNSKVKRAISDNRA